MRDLVDVWLKPRMRISMLLSALCYAALTIPFKDQWFAWGIEIRPFAFVPVLSSLIFGPAGAWGSAFGSLLSDSFGTFNNTTIISFLGNLFLGYLPYKLWFNMLRKDNYVLLLGGRYLNDLKVIFQIGIIANMFYALIVAWGAYWLQESSFTDVWYKIFINNSCSLVLLWPTLKWLGPLSERYEINWFVDQQKVLLSHITPRTQLFVMIAVVCIFLGSSLGIIFSILEAQLNFESIWYGISRQGLFWGPAIFIGFAAVYTLKD